MFCFFLDYFWRITWENGIDEKKRSRSVLEIIIICEKTKNDDAMFYYFCLYFYFIYSNQRL